MVPRDRALVGISAPGPCHRVADFGAYYRRVRASLEHAVRLDQTVEDYPDPKPFCDVCRWQERCDAKRHADDHLSLVAGISKIQIAELAEHEVATCSALAAMPIPLTFKPSRGSASALERVREQARIQVDGRAAGAMLYERLDALPGFGLAKLYEPSHGDIFLDFEGEFHSLAMVGLNICSATPSGSVKTGKSAT